MKPRRSLASLHVGICLFFATCCGVNPLHADDRSREPRLPNILFIMTDQHRWDCVGANGNRLIKTPNLDRLAAGGANFTHAFVQAPVCVPSRVSFFTGRYPHTHRNRVNYTPLSRSETLLQARLKAAGYTTASVGKLHLHPPTAEEARRTGFDFVELHDGVPSLDRFPTTPGGGKLTTRGAMFHTARWPRMFRRERTHFAPRLPMSIPTRVGSACGLATIWKNWLSQIGRFSCSARLEAAFTVRNVCTVRQLVQRR